jgi:mono/diheme cytochrome c family protein
MIEMAPDAGVVAERPDAGPDRLALCAPAKADPIPQRLSATAPTPTMAYDDLRQSINYNCGGCHLTPAINGTFTYQDAYQGSQITVGSKLTFVPGFFDVAQLMETALQTQKMPPDNIRSANPQKYLDLGVQIKAWLDAGRPQGTFPLPSSTPGGNNMNGAKLPPEIAEALTNIGDCLPKPGVVGSDVDKDFSFATASELPKNLSDTDLTTFDTLELAKKGTFAYAPTYVLFSDNAKKERLVHVPKGTSITLDPKTNHFVIPPNTRFYKTFFKVVVEADGHVGYRKIETRLIVSRQPWDQSLFGSYAWDDTETSATLMLDPYRSGDPFADRLFTYETSEVVHTTRHYAIPAKHRCIQCHQGAEGQNFVLGFTPLQINRRSPGAGGLLANASVSKDELGQVERLLSYGVLSGFTDASALPLLEHSGSMRLPRNDYELQAQAYFIGNCAHCHNLNGYATRQDDSLKTWDLSAGGTVFQYVEPPMRSIERVVPGDLANSWLYQRVSQASHFTGAGDYVQHMPLNSPGLDCNAVVIAARWILSIPVIPANATSDQIQTATAQALAKAAAFSSSCSDPADIDWLVEDFTEPSGPYMPRRPDWNTPPPNGIDDRFRNFVISDALRTFAMSQLAVGWWAEKPDCHFPQNVAPPADAAKRPWMFDGSGRQLQPWGELQYQTPGEFLFTNVCSKCHGEHADGTGPVGQVLSEATGGATRPANLMQGLFGPHSNPGQDLHLFDSLGTDGAAKYLMWMASGGTKAYFPPGFGGATDMQHRGNMLDWFRQQCKRFLPGGTAPPPDPHSSGTYEMEYVVCTQNNPIDPTKNYSDGSPDQTAWLDTAQANGGAVAYFFLKNNATQGKWVPLTCEEAFP